MMRCLLSLALFSVALASVTPASCNLGECEIAIVTDRSGSIGSQDLAERQFVEDLIELIFHHYNDAQIASFRYSRRVYQDEPLTNDKTLLFDKIDAWPGVGGTTHTHKGIDAAADELINNGRSTNTCRRMYVITDGKATYATSTSNAAADARARGIHIIAIGVGSGVDTAELNDIATDPDSDNVILAANFAAADQAITQNDPCLSNVPCDAKPARVDDGTWGCTAPVANGDSCTLTCAHGSSNGDSTAKCENGIWTGVLDELCPAAPCTGTPPAVADGTWSCPAPITSGLACVLDCTYGNAAGDGLRTCSNGVWDTNADDTCLPPCNEGSCDIMIVTDRSGSIGSQDTDEKQFVMDLINKVFHHYTSPQVGLVRYSSKAVLTSSLTADEAALRTDVNGWPGVGGKTNTHLAMELATDELVNDGRKGVDCKRMYVITDGKSTKGSLTVLDAAAARAAGIHMVAIGVGSGVDVQELNDIATDPDSDNVITAATFVLADQAITQNDQCLTSTGCDQPPVNVEDGTWTCTGPVAHQGTCAMTCAHGIGSPAGDMTATCVSGHWEGVSDEKCNPPACTGTPRAIDGGTWSCPALTSGSACTLTCTYGIKSGDGLATCHSAVWTGDSDDVCMPASCPTGKFSYSGSTYMFTSVPGSWADASMEASAVGGFLLSINTKEEQNFITQQMLTGSNADYKYWLGLHSATNPPDWTWDSKADLTYTNWEVPVSTPQIAAYGVMNGEYVLTGRDTYKGQWGVAGSNDATICGIIEAPPVQLCQCNTPVPADPSTCATAECSTLLTKNAWSFVMCNFAATPEFGNQWRETTPNNFVSTLNAGWTCAPADAAIASQC